MNTRWTKTADNCCYFYVVLLKDQEISWQPGSVSSCRTAHVSSATLTAHATELHEHLSSQIAGKNRLSKFSVRSGEKSICSISGLFKCAEKSRRRTRNHKIESQFDQNCKDCCAWLCHVPILSAVVSASLEMISRCLWKC